MTGNPPKTLPDLLIGIPIYEGVEPLDVVGAYEVFVEMAQMVEKQCTVEVCLLGETLDPVTTRLGMKLVPERTFGDTPRLDVIWVPGGGHEALYELMNPGSTYLEALRGWAADARWVTSVCDGAMLLCAAGLLDGYRATTHWAYYPCFANFPQVKPVLPNGNDWPRWVVDRNRVTGGGVSSALDEALLVVMLLFGQEVAEAVQVDIQYFPNPPVRGTIVPNNTCVFDTMKDTSAPPGQPRLDAAGADSL